MGVPDSRWYQLGDPASDAEAEALAAFRELLPDSPTTYVWTNVTFRDRSGRASEIDVILLHSNGLFVLEFKGWLGRIEGDQSVWKVIPPNGNRRVERDPFLANDGKAKRLASELKAAARALPHAARPDLPYLRAATVMHGQGSSVELSQAAEATTFSLDGYQVTGLRSIRRLLEQPATSWKNSIDGPRAKALVKLIGDLGLRPRPAVRMAGQYQITSSDPLGEGPGWVDVRARHPLLKNEFRRIRLYDVPPKATPAQRKDIERAAHREFALTAKLDHPGVTKALDVFATDAGPALLFDDDAQTTPLAEFLARSALDPASRLLLIRQIGEVLNHAHKRGVAHRALCPNAIRVRGREGRVTVHVRDWQAGRINTDTVSTTLFAGATEVGSLVSQDSWLYLAPEARMPSPQGIALDVYGLGALAYLILTDAPPAADSGELQQRLSEGGLDPAVARDGLSPEVCEVVRRATCPDLVTRTASIAEFLDELAAAQATDDAQGGPAADARLADKGSVIANRWIVSARLGSGSSGVALRVADIDLQPPREDVVLKVAVDESAAERLRTEAEVLGRLDHPRIVRRLDGPVDADGQLAIVLEDAGRPTLGRRLAEEGRATIEQLQIYGADLFEAVDYLASQGVFHRDIKPDNLGVREVRTEKGADRQRHLVLFDFSLAGEPLEKVGSGTQGYIDPFLRTGGRFRYDSAAERYAVAATLYEMATGKRPVYGDGASDPALTHAELVLRSEDFEPEIAVALMEFFGRALHPDVRARHDSISSMAQAWAKCFPPRVSAQPELDQQARDQAALAATLDTPLTDAGLTLQAVSAARRVGAGTVAELLDASGFQINSAPGVGVRVRSELQLRRREWSKRLRTISVVEEVVAAGVRSVEATQRALVPRKGSRAAAAGPLAERLLNLTAGTSRWPDLATAAKEAGLTGDRAVGMESLARYWANSKVVSDVTADVGAALAALAGIATAGELAERLIALRGSNATGQQRRRNAIGLVRAVVEGDGGATLAVLRHGNSVLVTGVDCRDPDGRLEAFAALARDVDDALADSGAPLGANYAIDLVLTHPLSDSLEVADPVRAITVAARASGTGALSSRGELYRRDMPAAAAVCSVLATAGLRIGSQRLRELARYRFPQALPVPDRPELDTLVAAAKPPMNWDGIERAYIRGGSGSALLSTGTMYAIPAAPLRYDAADEALRKSLAGRAATLLTASPDRLDEVREGLVTRYRVASVDVTAELIRAMHACATARRVDWSRVLRADALPPGGRDRRNLDRLVAEALDSFWSGLLAAQKPLLLTDLAPLARYDQLTRLASLLDTATPRPAARWLLVPKRAGVATPTLDGRPIPAPAWLELTERVPDAA